MCIGVLKFQNVSICFLAASLNWVYPHLGYQFMALVCILFLGPNLNIENEKLYEAYHDWVHCKISGHALVTFSHIMLCVNNSELY